nr:hypothetical protein BaRGS_032535 [Batillaria attramentaria]
MSDFYKYPTVTSVNVNYVTEEDFPAVTICDLNIFNELLLNGSEESVKMQMTYLTEINSIFHIAGRGVLDAILKNDTATHKNTNDSRMDIADLVNRSRHLIEQASGGLICSWGDYYWEPCSVALSTRVTEMGVCFTVDTRKLVKKEKGARRQVNAISNAIRGLGIFVTTVTRDIPYRLYVFGGGFKVVLHNHDEDPLPGSRGFLVDGNSTVEVEIEKHVRIGLESPFAAFGTGKCLDVEKPDFVNPLKRFHNYTKETCETECFVDYVVEFCGCRHFLHPGHETICALEHLKTCFRGRDGAEATYYRSRNVTQRKCDCPMPCKQSVYTAGVTAATLHTTTLYNEKLGIDDAVVSVHLFFPDPVVTTIEQVPVYSLEGLLGSIGGQVGLFMGFSLVTVAEMCELVFLLVTRGRLFVDEARRPIRANAH